MTIGTIKHVDEYSGILLRATEPSSPFYIAFQELSETETVLASMFSSMETDITNNKNAWIPGDTTNKLSRAIAVRIHLLYLFIEKQSNEVLTYCAKVMIAAHVSLVSDICAGNIECISDAWNKQLLPESQPSYKVFHQDGLPDMQHLLPCTWEAEKKTPQRLKRQDGTLIIKEADLAKHIGKALPYKQMPRWLPTSMYKLVHGDPENTGTLFLQIIKTVMMGVIHPPENNDVFIPIIPFKRMLAVNSWDRSNYGGFLSQVHSQNLILAVRWYLCCIHTRLHRDVMYRGGYNISNLEAVTFKAVCVLMRPLTEETIRDLQPVHGFIDTRKSDLCVKFIQQLRADIRARVSHANNQFQDMAQRYFNLGQYNEVDNVYYEKIKIEEEYENLKARMKEENILEFCT